jgi:hypothetical protein
VNQLRDTWRIKWHHRTNPHDWGHLHEGLWAAPYEMTAKAAARDAGLWLAHGFLVPGGNEHYPLDREVIVFTMNSGQPKELARQLVTRRDDRGPFFTSDGMEIPYSQKPDGSALETEEGWIRVRRY